MTSSKENETIKREKTSCTCTLPNSGETYDWMWACNVVMEQLIELDFGFYNV